MEIGMAAKDDGENMRGSGPANRGSPVASRLQRNK